MSMTRRNAPLTTFLLALPLMLLTRCTREGASDKPAHDTPDGGVAVVSCTTADQCELPPSTCAGEDILYYTNPRCEAGQCVWDSMTRACSVPGCYAGACQSPTMTAAGTPPMPCAGGSSGNAGGCAGNAGNGGMGGLDADAGSLTCDDEDDAGPGQCVP